MKKFINGKMINLADPRLGSKVIFKTDDFFASANRIINPNPPIFKDGVFDRHGKWMDGWETRRRRKKGFDYLIIKLGKPGRIFSVDIDTTHFSGNQPTHTSLEACYSNKRPNNKSKWISILNKKRLGPNKNHNFKIKNKSIFTHIKLNIIPDGGVARLRLFGEVEIKKANFGKKIINLASMLNGGSIVACNNEHFGKVENILLPGKSKGMKFGWETRRSRGKNYDWVIIKLGCTANISKIEIDTHYFKGNYPDRCSVQAGYIHKKTSNFSVVKKSNKWKTLLNKVKLNAHKKHGFKIKNKSFFNYIKLIILPDGGISRVKFLSKVIK